MAKSKPKKINCEVKAINEGTWKLKTEKDNEGKKKEVQYIEASFSLKGEHKGIVYSLIVKGNIGILTALKRDLRITQLKDKLNISIFPNQQTTLDEHT